LAQGILGAVALELLAGARIGLERKYAPAGSGAVRHQEGDVAFVRPDVEARVAGTDHAADDVRQPGIVRAQEEGPVHPIGGIDFHLQPAADAAPRWPVTQARDTPLSDPVNGLARQCHHRDR
jgi:hypothetical protein